MSERIIKNPKDGKPVSPVAPATGRDGRSDRVLNKQGQAKPMPPEQRGFEGH